MARTLPPLAIDLDALTALRRDLHAHPELAYAETRTAAVVAERLRAFGLDAVETGIARTGVVGTLRGRGEGSAVALRADMDALPLDEAPERAHRSCHAGRMHACGHDGHTAMLLGAARHLAQTRAFAGTVYFVFQPAEEGEGGGRLMVEEGLFERFPAERVFGLHNWPGLAVGRMAARAGPVMAAADQFDVEIVGRGAHGAMPQQGRDPVVAAAAVISALQTLVSRETDPLDSAVLSVTRVRAGEAYNIIPPSAHLGGTARSFRPEVRDALEAGLHRVATGVAGAYGCEARVDYRRGYPPTINSEAEARLCADVAAELLGPENVDWDAPPSMGGEDFAFLLQERPGAYLWIGNGLEGVGLHHPAYDFNDAVLPVGVAYWARLVERALPL